MNKMKALKDCKWEGYISGYKLLGYEWVILAKDGDIAVEIYQPDNHFKYKKDCTKNLKQFVKTNDIKNFEIL